MNIASHRSVLDEHKEVSTGNCQLSPVPWSEAYPGLERRVVLHNNGCGSRQRCHLSPSFLLCKSTYVRASSCRLECKEIGSLASLRGGRFGHQNQPSVTQQMFVKEHDHQIQTLFYRRIKFLKNEKIAAGLFLVWSWSAKLVRGCLILGLSMAAILGDLLLSKRLLYSQVTILGHNETCLYLYKVLTEINSYKHRHVLMFPKWSRLPYECQVYS